MLWRRCKKEGERVRDKGEREMEKREEGGGPCVRIKTGFRITREPRKRKGRKAYLRVTQDLHRAKLSNIGRLVK